jgi:prophage antirepressor-like protein
MNNRKMNSLQKLTTPIEIYHFQTKQLRVVGTHEEPWFAAKDICDILGIVNTHNSLINIPDKWKGVCKINTPSGVQEMSVVNEAGLYKQILRSNKPAAAPFQEWVCGEVLTSLRKKGEYVLQEYKEKIEKQKQLLNAQQSLIDDKERKLWKASSAIEKLTRSKNLLLNRRFYDWQCGHAVYLYHDKGSIYKVGKTQNIPARENDYSEYSKTGRMIYVKYCINSDLTEKVVHHLLNKYRMITGQEWFKLPDKNLAIQTIDLVVYMLDSNMDNIDSFVYDSFKKFNLESDNMNIKKDLPEPSRKIVVDQPETKEDFLDFDIKEDIEQDQVEGSETDAEDIEESSDLDFEEKQLTDTSISVEQRICKKKKQLVRQVNIKDFDKFIEDCCDLGKDLYDTKVQVRDVYRFWARQALTKEVKQDFEKYLHQRFTSSHHFYEIDSSRRNTFKGIRVKPLIFKPDKAENELQDNIEKFINTECKVDYSYRISFLDFIKYFETYTAKKYSYKEKEEIKNYLSDYFFSGSIFTSSEEKKKSNKAGVWGLGVAADKFGLKGWAKKNKPVQALDSLGNVLATYESCMIAAKENNYSYSKMSNYVKYKKLIDGKYFQYIT